MAYTLYPGRLIEVSSGGIIPNLYLIQVARIRFIVTLVLHILTQSPYPPCLFPFFLICWQSNGRFQNLLQESTQNRKTSCTKFITLFW